MIQLLNVCFQEAMSVGNVGWWVIGMYLRSVGYFLSVIILLSLVLMQLSQNFTFLWLTYWVKNRSSNSTNVTDIGLPDVHENTTLLDHSVMAIDNIVHKIINTTLALLNFNRNASILENENEDPLPVTKLYAAAPVYSDNFYLEMYFVLAALNLLFTVMRAFLFAYGGVKAAAKVHRMLLKVVIKVGIA
jgi:ATP-binding cassette, subfamily C (CFTR/MRP), member 10